MATGTIKGNLPATIISKTDASGVATIQGEKNTLYFIVLPIATYVFYITTGFGYASLTKIGGGNITENYDYSTGVLTLTGSRSSSTFYYRKIPLI